MSKKSVSKAKDEVVVNRVPRTKKGLVVKRVGKKKKGTLFTGGDENIERDGVLICCRNLGRKGRGVKIRGVVIDNDGRMSFLKK